MKSTDDRRLFGTLIGASAAAGNIATIPATQGAAGDGTASIALAFPPETFIARAAGGEPPRGADMNGFLNLLSSAVQVLQAGYLGPFDATFAAGIGGYPAGAVVSGSTAGTFWVSTADANTTVPGATGANWKSLFDGLATSAQLAAETDRANASESNLSTAISTVATNLNTEAQVRADADALKANLSGGNALKGIQTITGGGYFKVGSTVDGSSVYLGMDGTTAGMATLVLVNASGAIANVMRLDANDLSVLAGSGMKVSSTVDSSYCRFTMDGSTGTMADLILVNPSGAIANVLRLMSDGTASISAGTLATTSQLPTSGTVSGGFYFLFNGVRYLNFKVSLAAGANARTIAFPVAFSSVPNVNLTSSNEYGGSHYGVFVSVNQSNNAPVISATSVEVYTTEFGGGTGQPVDIWVHAVGNA